MFFQQTVKTALNQPTPPLERRSYMKHLLLTTIAAVVLVGCGELAINKAVYDGNIDAVKQAIAAGVDVNLKDGAGFNPLYFAASGHKEIAELLIAEGADVNAKSIGGMTPLHSATTKEIAELLIATGADVNAKEDYGATPLDVAEEFNLPELASILRKHGGKTGEELKAEGK